MHRHACPIGRTSPREAHERATRSHVRFRSQSAPQVSVTSGRSCYAVSCTKYSRYVGSRFLTLTAPRSCSLHFPGRVLDAISLILSGESFTPPGAPPRPCGGQPAQARETESSKIILALKTFANFDFRGLLSIKVNDLSKPEF